MISPLSTEKRDMLERSPLRTLGEQVSALLLSTALSSFPAADSCLSQGRKKALNVAMVVAKRPALVHRSWY